jgi:hypothetical protein
MEEIPERSAADALEFLLAHAGWEPLGAAGWESGAVASRRLCRPGGFSVMLSAPMAARKKTSTHGSPPPPKKPLTHPVKERTAADERLAERLRTICLALPEAGERLSHGEPTWFAGKGKVFAMLDSHHHGASHLSVWLPQPLGVQESLIEHDPERFFRPPYVGPSGWVGVVLDTGPDWKVVEVLVRDAFVHVATRKLVAQLGGAPPAAVHQRQPSRQRR